MALAGSCDWREVPSEIIEADRLYQLVTITGWTPEVIDRQPAVTLDYLMEIHNTHQRVQAEMSREAMER